MTVVWKGGKKGTTSKRNPCPPGSKKSDGTKARIQPPNKRKTNKAPKKPKYDPMAPKDKAPKKPPNKRTGEDFLDKEKTGWGGSRGGKARPLNLEDLRERIKKDKEGRKNRRKTLPYKI